MTPSSVTCPHCQTPFRITNVQLKAAKGSVRCGSCLQVFNALEQLERTPVEPLPVNIVEPVTVSEESEPSIDEQKSVLAPPVNPQQKQETPSNGSVANNKAKLSASTPPLEYDGYHHETIETLVFEDEDDIPGLRKNNQKSSPLLKISIALLSLALVVQYGWFNRNQLALNTSFRPVYSLICQWTGCALSPLYNIKSIRSLDLVVRTHPENSLALQIDAVIINGAKHSQPYPNIQLTFTDINGRLIASRSFKPSEYLGGELAGSDIMPKDQPIRLGLEIMDPGPGAVNYQLSFTKNSGPVQ